LVNLGEYSIPAPEFAKVDDKVLEWCNGTDEAFEYLKKCFSSNFVKLSTASSIEPGQALFYNSNHPKCGPAPPAVGYYRYAKVEFRKGNYVPH
jgi:hypothetical protein